MVFSKACVLISTLFRLQIVILVKSEGREWGEKIRNLGGEIGEKYSAERPDGRDPQVSWSKVVYDFFPCVPIYPFKLCFVYVQKKMCVFCATAVNRDLQMGEWVEINHHSCVKPIYILCLWAGAYICVAFAQQHQTEICSELRSTSSWCLSKSLSDL